MSAHIELAGKQDIKCEAYRAFHHPFATSSTISYTIVAQMSSSIYHMSFKLVSYRVFGVKKNKSLHM